MSFYNCVFTDSPFGGSQIVGVYGIPWCIFVSVHVRVCLSMRAGIWRGGPLQQKKLNPNHRLPNAAPGGECLHACHPTPALNKITAQKILYLPQLFTPQQWVALCISQNIKVKYIILTLHVDTGTTSSWSGCKIRCTHYIQNCLLKNPHPVCYAGRWAGFALCHLCLWPPWAQCGWC